MILKKEWVEWYDYFRREVLKHRGYSSCFYCKKKAH